MSCMQTMAASEADPILEAVLAVGCRLGEIIAAALPDDPAALTPAAGVLCTTEGITNTFYKNVPTKEYAVNHSDEVGSGGFASVYGITVSAAATILPHPKGASDREHYVAKLFSTPTLVSSGQRRLQWEVSVSRMFPECESIHRAAGGTISRGCNGIIMPRADETLSDFANRFAARAHSATAEQFAAYYGFVAWAFAHVAAALETMHAANILHCDVKPLNMLLTANKSNGKGATHLPAVTLADFDCASLVDDVHTAARVKWVKGTAFYMPPESFSLPQAELEKLRLATQNPSLNLQPTISSKTDVFALGASLSEMLNFGTNVFLQHFETTERFSAHLQSAATAAQSDHLNEEELSGAAFTVNLRSRAPVELVEVAELCLVLNPSQRISMVEARQRLCAFVERLGSAVAMERVCVREPYSCNVRIFAERPTEHVEAIPISTDDLQRAISEQEATRWGMYEDLLEQEARLASLDYPSTAAFNGGDSDNDEDKAWSVAEKNRIRKAIMPDWRFAGLLEKSTALSETHKGSQVYEGPRKGRFIVTNNGRVQYLPKALSASPGAILTGRTLASSGRYAGAPIYQGPKGGFFYLTESGEKRYVKGEDTQLADTSAAVKISQAPQPLAQPPISSATSTGRTLASSGRYAGAPIYQGPKGGFFYLTESGEKRYVRGEDTQLADTSAAAKPP